MLQELLKTNPAYSEQEGTLYLMGLNAFQKRSYEKALGAFEKLKNPNAATLYYSGKCLMELGKPLLATGKFQKLIQEFPKSALLEEANYLLADSYFAAGDYLSSLTSFQNFIKAYPNSIYRYGAVYKIGLAHFSRENYLEARSSFQELISLILSSDANNDFVAWSQYLTGESFRKEQRLHEAAFSYGDMANTFVSNPFAANALYKMSWCYYTEKDYQTSEINLRKLIKSYPTHSLIAAASLLLGNCLTKQERYTQAIAAYQSAVDISFPGDIAESALALANRCNLLSQNYGSLVSGYHLVLNNYPPSPSPWRALTYLYIGDGYFRNAMYAEAANIFRSVIKLYPTAPSAPYALDGLAWSLFKLGNHQEASQERSKLKKYQEEPEAPKELLSINEYELGNTLFNQKKYLEALGQFEKFVKENPSHETSPEAYFRIGQCHYHLAYYGQAIETWENLEKTYPASKVASKAAWRIGDTYFRAQEYYKAIATYRRIHETYAQETDASLADLRVAQSYYNLGQSSTAIATFKDLILEHADSPQGKEALDFLNSLLETQHAADAMDALRAIASSVGQTTAIAAEAQFLIAQYYFDKKNYEQATPELEKLGGLFLAQELVAQKEYYLGESYYQLGRFTDAVGTLERLVTNFPSYDRLSYALFRLGSAYFKVNRFDESGATFTRLANDYPKTEFTSIALYNTCISYKKAKLFEQAHSACAQYLERFPEKAKESRAQEEIANIYQEQKNYSAAIASLEKARKTLNTASSQYGEITIRIAENHDLMGQSTKAVLEYEKVLSSLPPQNDSRLTASFKLGELYEKSELWQEAVNIYEDIAHITKQSRPDWAKAAEGRVQLLRLRHPEAFAQPKSTEGGKKK